MDWPTETGTFEAGDLPLRSGEVLARARLSWKTHGVLSAAKDNVVVYPTSYSAQHPDLEFLIGPDGILDPTRWFIVIPDMLGNGLSSSPSNTADYPDLVTVADNVRLQRRFLAGAVGHRAGGRRLRLVDGRLQAYHWAALFPDAVDCAIIVCGVARTAVHNRVFLRSLMATLEAAPEHLGGGRFSAEPFEAKRAFGRIYAGWALSQDFYRAGLHLASGPSPNLGAPDLDTFLRTQWEETFEAHVAAEPVRAAAHLGDGRHRRQRALPGRPGPGARRDPGAGAVDARHDRSVLPGRRQRSRAAVPAPGGVAPDPEHLGPPGRQPEGEPGGLRLHP